MHGIVLQGGHKPGKSGILGEFCETAKLPENEGNFVQPRKTVTDKIGPSYYTVCFVCACVHSAWTGRPQNDLYCVGWDDNNLTHSLT